MDPTNAFGRPSIALRRLAGPSMAVPSTSCAEASIVTPSSIVRQRPIAS